MEKRYRINEFVFDSEDSFLNFIYDNAFLVYIAHAIKEQNATKNIVLTFTIHDQTDNETYLELTQLKTEQHIFYNWTTSYETVRRSGGNYSDPTSSQTESIKYFQSLIPKLEKILKHVGIDTSLKQEDITGLPF